MFINFIKIAWRNIKRQKIYSIINIAGFAIGLTISLVLAFYVLDDITFDRFHKDANSIYRIIMNSAREGGNYQNAAIISGPLLPASKNEIPEVLNATRLIIFNQVPIVQSDVERTENDDAVRANILAVDSDFFDIFSFKILSGNISDFEQPNAVFITPDIASAVFGEEDPSRKPLQIPNVQDAYVAGIVEAPPNNSHIQFDVIVPLRVELNPVWWDSWENQVLSGYIRIHKNADPKLVEEKITNLAKSHDFPDVYIPALQPLLDIHLGSSDLAYDFRNFGKKDSSIIYVMSAIGFMILLVASINFINLSSARAVQRAREVGLRKVVGSKRWQLILQFLGESIFVTLISMFIAMFIIQISLPYLENFLQKQLEINFISNPLLILVLLGFAILVGFCSGIYPALILSTFKPVKVLKGEFKTSKSGVMMRRILVISQFAITVALIVGVFTVIIQINYLKSLNLGYNREQVLGIPNFLGDREDILKNQLENMPGVLSVGRSSRLMGEGLSIETIPEGTDPSKSVNWSCIYIDEDFFKTLEISIAHGRNFSSEITSDVENAAIINEAGLKLADWDRPLGKRIEMIMEAGSAIPRQIVGVVKDFHFSSTREAIEPMVFLMSPRRSAILLARLTANEIVQTREQIETAFGELFPNQRANFFFLDNIFDRQFNNDREFATHIGFFSGVAIFIACLGLIGLVSFAVEQRRKEIAVRKVLGCSERIIVVILAMDFLKWIVLANLIAWPLGYFSMEQWLNEFTYRVPFSIWPFLFSGTGALFIAMLTMSFQSIRASRTNPADALRQEM